MQLTFLMDEMLRECKCTESMDLMIGHLARRNNYEGALDVVVKARTGTLE